MNKQRKIPDLMLEQYMLNELSECDKKSIDDQLVYNSELKQQLETLADSNRTFYNSHPIDWFIKKTFPKQEKEHNFWSFLAWKPVLVPALCTLLIVPLLLITMKTMYGHSDTRRAKGDIDILNVYRKTTLGSELLIDGATVRQKDLVQLEYIVSDSNLYGMIVSIDGNSSITVHLGTDDGVSVVLEHKKRLLNFSYEFDAAPSFEKFFFITSQNSFSLNEIINKCKRMEKSSFVNDRFYVKMLTFNKIVLQGGAK